MPDTVALDRPVRLHALRYLAEGDEIVIGRVDTDSYAVFPPDGAAVVERLAAGETPGAIADWYRRTYSESLDVLDLVLTLVELDFVDDGPPTGAGARPRAEPDPPVARVAWQRLGRVTFSRTAMVLYAAVLGITVAACIIHPALVPHRDHAFFTGYLLVVEVTLAAGQVPLILIHECFHVLAARRLGLGARIRVSHRLYFVVFETVMDGLVLVPRRQRYLPILAGMLADLVLAALLTLAGSAVTVGGGPRVVAGMCLALALTTLVRFVMEFMLFLRTDIYFLATTSAGCVDLHSTCREMLANRLWRAVRRPERLVDPARWHPRDVRAARWYLPLFVAGYTVAIGLFAEVLLPISWRFFGTAVRALWRGDLTSSYFWDAFGVLLLNLSQPAVAGVVALRERSHRRRGHRATTARLDAHTAEDHRTSR